MTSQAIISLAILKVNWDVLGKDYLENFVPIVAECIQSLPNDIVSLSELQSELKKCFGFQIPQNAIVSILRRVQKHGYIKLENRIYTRNNVKLSQLNFRTVQQQVLRMHESVIDHLIQFCAEKYKVIWNQEEADQALQAYIEENQLSIVAYSRDFIPLIPSTDTVIKGGKYLVGAFIKHLQETYASDFEYLETIVKGNLLANAIFLTDPSSPSRRFRKTAIFFDTSFLVFALGHAGKARKDPCIELLQMLYESGADLKCFRHTLEEMRGILDACAYRIRPGHLRDAYGPSIEYFISIGLTSSDIELLIINLERDLASLHIQVVDKPAYIPQYVIDEQKLDDVLRNNIPYHNSQNSQAPQRDVDSVSAIMRLRHGRDYFVVEECKALFVTTNNSLVKVARDFFYDESPLNAVPPCIPDYVLTNLLWLKRPLRAPDLPRKRIIADCFAATQPEESLWRRYLVEIEKLKQQGRITSDNSYFLRASLEAKSALMEITLGEEEAFTQGTVPEILEIVRSHIQKEKDEEVMKEKEMRQEAEQAMESFATKERERRIHIKVRAQRYAHATAQVLEYMLLVVLFVGMISTFPWDLPELREELFKYLVSILQAGLLILSIANLMYGTMLKTYVRKVEVMLAGQFEKKILVLSEG